MVDIIQVKNLKYGYPDGSIALDAVDFCVREGECVGVIGANGAGKTTLLLHMNGILQCCCGSVVVNGRKVSEENLCMIRREVGLVFQDPDSQLFMPTVFDDVAFGPINMGLDAQEVSRRVITALESVDMVHCAKKISHHLSFGEKKRVSVATVLSMNPKILVLDEPTSNLDPKHRRQLIGILKGISVTKIIASHDLDMISRLTDRVLFLRDGRAAAYIPTDRLLTENALLEELGFCPTEFSSVLT